MHTLENFANYQCSLEKIIVVREQNVPEYKPKKDLKNSMSEDKLDSSVSTHTKIIKKTKHSPSSMLCSWQTKTQTHKDNP